MKISLRLFFPVLAALVSLSLPRAQAADSGPSPAPTPAEADVTALADRIGEKLRQNQAGAADYTAESAEYDALLEKYRGQHEAEATILLNRAVFTEVVLRDPRAMKLILERIVREYADTKEVEMARKVIAAMTPEAMAAREARATGHAAKAAALLGRPAPEIDFTWSTREGLNKLSDLRGKVVVLDFWATWCGPCIASFPDVREKVERFRGSPVVFLGVTSLQGKVHRLEPKPIDVADQPEREYELTARFKKKFEMTWDIAFSAQKVFNPDYAVQGIPSVAIIAPDGTVRAVALHPGTAGAEIDRKVQALLEEFKLPAPGAKS